MPQDTLSLIPHGPQAKTCNANHRNSFLSEHIAVTKINDNHFENRKQTNLKLLYFTNFLAFFAKKISINEYSLICKLAILRILLRNGKAMFKLLFGITFINIC